MTLFSNLFFNFIDGHHDWYHLTLKLCDWSWFINHFTRTKMICWFFICQNRPISVCHTCPAWRGWAAARFVWIELFLLTIVFLQISVPTLTRPPPCSAALKSCSGRKESFREFFDARRDNRAPSWFIRINNRCILSSYQNQNDCCKHSWSTKVTILPS